MKWVYFNSFDEASSASTVGNETFISKKRRIVHTVDHWSEAFEGVWASCLGKENTFGKAKEKVVLVRILVSLPANFQLMLKVGDV